MTGQGPGRDRTRPADHPRAILSPREAARFVGVGRSSIMRAIAAGDLLARRDNRNQWQIDREALDRWRAARPDPDRALPTNPDRTPDRATSDHLTALAQELTEARAQAAEERARADQLEARLEERAALVRAAEARAQAAEADRDGWRALAGKLTDQLAARPTDSPAEPPAPARRAWRWPWT